MPSPRSIDIAEAQRFLTLLAEDEPLTFQTFGDRDKSPALSRILHGTLEQSAGELGRLNTRGGGVFVMVNAGDGRGRKAENVTRVRACFVDLDGAPIGPVYDAGVEPHLIVESSEGRFHAYWLLHDCALARFASVQSALAARFGGDPSVKDLPRVMRIPGYWHLKEKPFRTRIVQSAERLPYALADIERGLQLINAGEALPLSAADTVAAPGTPVVNALSDREVSRVRSALSYCGNAEQYRAWLEVGMMLHERTLGAEQGFGLWANWSQQSSKYDLKVCRQKWATFGKGAQVAKLDLGSLFHTARSNGWRDPNVAEPSAVVAELWPKVSLREPDVPPHIPPALLPGWLGDMAAAVAEATQTPPALAVMLSLSVLAATLQRRFEVAPFGDGYTEPLCLWTLSALSSGSRKTAVLNQLLEPLVLWEKHQESKMRSDIARAYAAREVALKRIEHLKLAAAKADSAAKRYAFQEEIQREKENMPAELRAPRLFSGDTTSERLQQLMVEQDERMAVFSDEAGIFYVMAGMYSGGVASIDVFLQAHAGSPVRVDRATRHAQLDRPALTFGLALQPGLLAEAAGSRRFRDSGMNARFLYVVPASNIGTRNVRYHAPVPAQVRADYLYAIEDLLDKAPLKASKPQILSLTPQAREMFLCFMEDIEVAQGDGGRLESIRDWTAKLPGAVARIAGLLELARGDLTCQAVGADSIGRAIDLGGLLIPHAQAAFRLLGAEHGADDQASVLRWIRTGVRREFTRRELHRALVSRFARVEPLEAALQGLVDANALRMVMRRPEGGGRPSVSYVVNPRLHER